MSVLKARPLEAFRSGQWKVMATTEAGVREESTKEGTVHVDFGVGEAVLVGGDDRIICGPISFVGAITLAGRVLDGNQRVVTDSHTQLMLAAAVVAFSQGAHLG